MELEQARKRAEELRVIIERNNRLYYDQDAPEQTCLQSDNDSPVQKAVSADTLQALCFLIVSQTYSDCVFPEKQYPPSESFDLAHIRNEL